MDTDAVRLLNAERSTGLRPSLLAVPDRDFPVLTADESDLIDRRSVGRRRSRPARSPIHPEPPLRFPELREPKPAAARLPPKKRLQLACKTDDPVGVLRAVSERKMKDETLGIALVQAARRGNSKAVQALCEVGVDLDFRDGFALYKAARAGHPSTILTLLDYGARNMDRSSDREFEGLRCPVTTAARWGRVAVLRTLLLDRTREVFRAVREAANVGYYLDLPEKIVSLVASFTTSARAMDLETPDSEGQTAKSVAKTTSTALGGRQVERLLRAFERMRSLGGEELQLSPELLPTPKSHHKSSLGSLDSLDLRPSFSGGSTTYTSLANSRSMFALQHEDLLPLPAGSVSPRSIRNGPRKGSGGPEVIQIFTFPRSRETKGDDTLALPRWSHMTNSESSMGDYSNSSRVSDHTLMPLPHSEDSLHEDLSTINEDILETQALSTML